MPPRSAKKASGGSSGAKKAAARTPKATAKSTSQPKVAVEEPVAAVEVKEVGKAAVVPARVVEIKEEFKVEQVVDEKTVVVAEATASHSKDAESVTVVKDNIKESIEEEDKDERLDLEANEPEEYDPEEEIAVDYDERDIEHDGGAEEVDEIEYAEGDDLAEDEEHEMADEELEDNGDDAEGEEDFENVEDNELDPEEQEQHKVFQEHRKRKEFEVFVGGLDKDATEDDLRKVFSQAGEITEVRLMMNPLIKKNRGFAFLRFCTVDQAKRALSELKNPLVRGKKCGVAPCQDNDTLFVGNICRTWTKEHLKEKLKSYGVENIQDLTLVEDSNSEGMNRGFSFLEFSSRSDAMDAYKRLQKRDVVFGVDRTAKVSYADSFVESDDEIMAQVKTVFIDGLPAAWDEDRVKEHLKKYGNVEKIELARNMPAANRKDFGFVTFDTHDSAVACAEGINNMELGEGTHKVKVRARLSRPHQRGRVKRGLRGDFRIGWGASRIGHVAYPRPPPPHRFPFHPLRPIGGHGLPIGGRELRRPIGSLGYRDRRRFVPVLERPRRLPPPERSYDRRPPLHPYPKSSIKRDYGQREELPPPKSRAPVEYGARIPSKKHSSYRDGYPTREPAYSDIPFRNPSRPVDRRGYIDEGYGRKFGRPIPSYREGRSRDYDSVSGSKRPYAVMDDARYEDVNMHQSRTRLDYDVSSSSSQYGDTYGDRLGRSHVGYNSSRPSLSGQGGLYGGRQGMSYSGGSVSGNDVGGMYSSGYSNSYMNRGSDVGGSSYSSLYPGRSFGGSGYMGGSGSGSYY